MRRALSALAMVWLAACQAAPSTGALCHRASDCASPLVCARGRCRDACARSDDCGPRERCLVDPATNVGSCSLDVDSCRNHDCPVGFLCRDDACLNACGTIVQCPDGVCADGACVPVHGDAGVTPDDASVDGGAPPSILTLGGGGSHFCAVTSAHELWCWGASARSELGDRLIGHGDCGACSATPVRALDATGHVLAGVTAMAGSHGFTCALIGGQVLCWGAGPLGTLATSSTDPQRVSVVSGATIAPLDGVTALTAGIEHACAMTASGPWCWGINLDGRLGDGTTNDAPRAVLASALPPIQSLVAARHHTQALTSNGRVVGVGNNDSFELGVAVGGTTTTPATATVPTAVEIATEGGVTCARFQDGTIGCWGLNNQYLVGMPPLVCPDGACSIVPTMMPVPAGEIAAGMALTRYALCVWTVAGHVLCAGDPAVASSPDTLTVVPGPSGVQQLVSGDDAVCARTSDGHVSCWGSNANGQLGRGTHDDGTFPTPGLVLLPP